MLHRLARIQLMIFAFVTVVTVGAISIFYLHVPAAVGLGSYQVDANFVAGGGIYQNANVTYRGVTIGRVESVGLTNDGVVADMRLNSNTPVPDNVTATVKSVSAVGEQYIDLVPPAKASNAMLRNGSSIDRDRTAIGQDIAGMLNQADQLVSSVSNSRLQDLLKETFKAFNGSGPELARLIQSSRLLVDEANANYGQTSALIDQAGPFLDAQVRSGDNIKSLADGLARFTTELQKADPQVRTLLQTAPSTADAANTAFTGIRPNFPMLAANLANLGRIGVIYHKSIEQALVIFPALIAGLITVAGGVPQDEGGKLDFKIDLGDPPPCSTGFIPATEIRSPADETIRDLPSDLYCKVAQNDPSVVRGARNYPCQEFPGKRAPTVQLCRDPRRLCADRKQPLARTAGAVRHADHGRPEYLAAQQVPEHPTRRGLRPRSAGGIAARRAVGPGTRAQRAVPAAGPAERPQCATTTAVAVLRATGPGRAALRASCAGCTASSERTAASGCAPGDRAAGRSASSGCAAAGRGGPASGQRAGVRYL